MPRGGGAHAAPQGRESGFALFGAANGDEAALWAAESDDHFAVGLGTAFRAARHSWAQEEARRRDKLALGR